MGFLDSMIATLDECTNVDMNKVGGLDADLATAAYLGYVNSCEAKKKKKKVLMYWEEELEDEDELEWWEK